MTDAVARADDLEAALDAIVVCLRPRFELWHANIASHRSGDPHITLLAAWSMAESVFDAGTKLSATISPLVTSVLATLREGSCPVFSVGGDQESLVDQLLREQGVASAIGVPIHVDEHAVLFLGLGSSAVEMFQQPTGGFFSALSAAVRAPLLKLATARNV